MSIGEEKALEEIQHALMLKILRKLGKEQTLYSTGEKVDFSFFVQNKKSYAPLITLFNIRQEVHANATRKRNKTYLISKRSKAVFVTGDVIISVQIPKE